MTAEDQKEVAATMKLLQDVVCLAFTRTLDPEKTEALNNEYANAFGRSLHNTLKSRLGNACFQLYKAWEHTPTTTNPNTRLRRPDRRRRNSKSKTITCTRY